MEGKWKRAEFVDIAKGIAIISVIIGHTWSVYSPMDKRLTIFIYSFHMPLFFMLSGAVFASSPVVSFKTLVKKKTKRLILPYFVYGFAFMFLIFILSACMLALLTTNCDISIS